MSLGEVGINTMGSRKSPDVQLARQRQPKRFLEILIINLYPIEERGESCHKFFLTRLIRMVFIGFTFPSNAPEWHGDYCDTCKFQTSMNFFYAGSKISEMFLNFQTNDEAKLIIGKVQPPRASFNDVRLVTSFSP